MRTATPPETDKHHQLLLLLLLLLLLPEINNCPAAYPHSPCTSM
jgi:hypothetical protein